MPRYSAGAADSESFEQGKKWGEEKRDRQRQQFHKRQQRSLESELINLRNEMIAENQALRESLLQVKAQLQPQSSKGPDEEERERELFDAFACNPGQHTYEPIAKLASRSPVKPPIHLRPVISNSADKSLASNSQFVPVPRSQEADEDMSKLDALINSYLETEKRLEAPSKGRASRLASRGQMVLGTPARDSNPKPKLQY